MQLTGRAVLAVVARRPEPGKVKTRLAAAIGDTEAAAVYARLLGETVAAAEQLDDVALVLAAEGAAAPEPLADPARWLTTAQRGGTLGERLGNAFVDLFAAGAEAVVLVGSDSPALPADYLRRAFALLAGAPAALGRLVLGPTADGGYYLIGVDRSAWRRHGEALVSLLAASPMSSPRLLSFTRREAGRLRLPVVQLPLWIDVDTVDDLAATARLYGEQPPRGTSEAGLREVYLHVTHRCARACRHCYDRAALGQERELTTAEWRDVIDQCVALGAGSFVFIGGEPLLRDDFTALLDHVTGRHGARARFFFNSRITAARARELAAAGHGRLRPLASIDGPRPINDALREPGSYDDVMHSLAPLLEAGLEPVANTVLVRPALPGLTQLARELRAAGIRRLHLILPHQRGTLPGAPDLVPTGAELLAAVRELCRVAAEIGLLVDNLPSWRRRLGARHDFCAAGCRDLAIDPYGNVHACVITAGDPAFVAGSLRAQRLSEIWRASRSLRLLRAARARDRAACRECPVVDACGGECWVQAHYAAPTRGELAGYRAAFPYCEFVRPLLEELRGAAGQAPGAAGTGAAGCGGQASAGAADYALFDCI